MTQEFKQYNEYQLTDYDWLPELPSKWTLERFSNIVKIKSVTTNSPEELLSVYLNLGVVRYSDTTQMQVHKPSEDMSKYQLVDIGDFVMNNQQAWRGSVGVSKYRGIVSPAYFIFELSDRLNRKFANYLLRDSFSVDQYVLCSKGVGSIQRMLSFPKLKNVTVIIPPISEQENIVNFLDSKISKINKFIKEKKREIELLKEQKKTKINHAVTKGINPNVTMKEVRLNWMVEVPLHWKCERFSNVVKIKSVTTNSPEELLSVYLNLGVVRYSDTNQMQVHKPSEDMSKYQLVDVGDFVLNNQQAWRGSVGVSKYKGIVSPAYFVFELSDEFNKEYANYMFRDSFCVDQYVLCSKGVGSIQRMLSFPKLKNVTVIIPPLSEQEQIVKYLKNYEGKVDFIIESIESEIIRIREYKISLINKVVTGKFNVSDIMIDDIPELETLDEIDVEVEEEHEE